MKLSCLKSNLLEGLNIVGRVVPSKSTLPVLGNVLLATDRGRLKLAATNLDLAVSCWVGASVASEGRVTLPARLLTDFVSSLPDEPIELSLQPKSLTMRLVCGRYQANIKGVDAEEFPRIPEVADAASYALPVQILRECIQSVVFAAAPDDTRPVLAGVLFTLRDGVLTLAAADGFRLAVRSAELSSTPAEPLSLIVPAKTLAELARLLGDGDEPVEIAATPERNQMLFRLGSRAEIVSRLIEGQFPDYQKIIPRSHTTRAVLNTSELLRATKAASVFARDNAMIVRLALTPSSDDALGRVQVSATAAEVGDNAGEIDASVEGSEMQIAFNGRYLRDALEAIDAEQVSLEIVGPTNPGVLRPLSEANGYLHVIMPMQINSGR